jgi:hypothetical protein
LPAFRVELRGPAREFYERAPVSVQAKLDAIFSQLEDDPFVDHVRRVEYLGFLPAVCSAWNDDEFRVVYQLVEYPNREADETVIDVWAISRAEAY